MLISHKHKFVFAHVPKTGGDSITEALREFADVDKSWGRPKHWSARRIRDAHFLGTEFEWGQHLSFGVIRNPWEQVHSDYWFCRNSRVPGPKLGSWRDKVIRCKEICFAEFVVDICGAHGRSGPGLFSHYLADRSGNQMVSHIMRFERLEEEFAGLCQSIGLPGLDLPRKNVTPRRPDYRDEYDDRSRYLVGRRFADDVGRFGYTFGGK